VAVYFPDSPCLRLYLLPDPLHDTQIQGTGFELAAGDQYPDIDGLLRYAIFQSLSTDDGALINQFS
jgi:hypothetical protein